MKPVGTGRPDARNRRTVTVTMRNTSVATSHSINTCLVTDRSIPAVNSTNATTAARLWRALADPHQLESAILNLAVNSRDAAAMKKLAGRLDLILEAEGDSTNRYKISKQPDVTMLFFLLSDDASFVTGTSLIIDGGYTAQ